MGEFIGILMGAETGGRRRSSSKARLQRGNLLPLEAKCGGLEVNELRRLRQLEHENARLRPLVADGTMYCNALKQLVGERAIARGVADRGAGTPGEIRTE